MGSSWTRMVVAGAGEGVTVMLGESGMGVLFGEWERGGRGRGENERARGILSRTPHLHPGSARLLPREKFAHFLAGILKNWILKPRSGDNVNNRRWSESEHRRYSAPTRPTRHPFQFDSPRIDAHRFSIMSTAALTLNKPARPRTRAATMSRSTPPPRPSFAEWAKASGIVSAKPSKRAIAEAWVRSSGIVSTGIGDLSTREGFGY